MLSRVAENLFWIGRYMERAETVARLLDAARRMAALPQPGELAPSNEWSSILIAAGARETLGEAIEHADQDTAIQHLIFDTNNPSSVVNCIRVARENAREVRFALTQECWEALNSTWTETRALGAADVEGSALGDTLDWIKSRSALFRGSVNGTMIRDDGFDFIRIGASLERTDATARLLDVKYHVLLPSVSDVGSGRDYYQWQSLLKAAAAIRAYSFLMKDDISAKGVAQFLILQRRFPRSILFNVNQAREAMVNLDNDYERRSPCREAMDAFANQIGGLTISDIFNTGLHEFLTAAIGQNYQIANLVASSYGFGPILAQEQTQEDAAGQ